MLANRPLTRRLQQACLLSLLGALTACITINIYFPAAAAEKAADKVIDEIWQLPPEGQPAPAGQAPVNESSVPAVTDK